jgi:hypothetical protein
MEDTDPVNHIYSESIRPVLQSTSAWRKPGHDLCYVCGSLTLSAFGMTIPQDYKGRDTIETGPVVPDSQAVVNGLNFDWIAVRRGTGLRIEICLHRS